MPIIFFRAKPAKAVKSFAIRLHCPTETRCGRALDEARRPAAFFQPTPTACQTKWQICTVSCTVEWGDIGISGLFGHPGTQLPKTAVARLLAELCDSISPGQNSWHLALTWDALDHLTVFESIAPAICIHRLETKPAPRPRTRIVALGSSTKVAPRIFSDLTTSCQRNRPSSSRLPPTRHHVDPPFDAGACR